MNGNRLPCKMPTLDPQVPESAFATYLARHNTYLQECTGNRDIGYVSTCHDLKLLLLRFALERSFSDESGGGGPHSNMHFLPYLNSSRGALCPQHNAFMGTGRQKLER